MKPYLISIAILIAAVALGDFPTHSNVATSDVHQISGAWNSFDWGWAAYNSQTSTVTIKTGSTAIDLSGGSVLVRIGQNTSTGFVSSINLTNVTVSNSNVIFSTLYTNVPSPGKYLCEGLYYEGTTNLTRSIWQGKITVYDSIYRE